MGAISITGADAPSNGSCYVANNAVGTVQWGITKGSINSNGCVSGISTQCGTATITATDSCGETGTKNLKMPIGVWVNKSTCDLKAYYEWCGWYDGGFYVYGGIYRYNNLRCTQCVHVAYQSTLCPVPPTCFGEPYLSNVCWYGTCWVGYAYQSIDEWSCP